MKIKLLNNDERKGTDYIEFVRGTWHYWSFWNKDSLYLGSSEFSDILNDCFPNFSFTGPEKVYTSQESAEIILLLQENKKLFAAMSSLEELIKQITRYGRALVGDLEYENGKDWSKDWKEVRSQILETHDALIQFIQNLIDTDTPLTVLGV